MNNKSYNSSGGTLYQAIIASSILATSLLSESVLAESGKGVSALMEEVQVVARKKSQGEMVQDVPVAITAYSAEQLEAKFVVDLEGLSFSMPNVTLDDIGTANGTANFSIRGLGINSSIPSIDPTVGVFVDGIYLGITSGVIYDFFDLEGIEVLRGPQGTLFGRNVTGGAILLKTARPTQEFSAKAKAAVESGSEGISNKIAAFAVNGGLVEDTLSGKLAVYTRDNDGWYKNLATGDQFGEESVDMVRGALQWDPTDAVSAFVSYETGQMETQGPASQNRGLYDKNSFDFSVGTEGFSDSEWQNGVLEVNFDVGNGVITNLFGWRDYESEAKSDIDGQEAILFDARFKTFQNQLSNELRYAGQLADNLDFTAGAYWFTQDIEFYEHRLIPPPGIDAAMGGKQEQTTTALFTQLDYTPFDKHIFTLGLRYSREEKDVKVATFNPPAPLCDIDAERCDYDFVDDNTWTYGTYRLGYQWLVEDNAQIYVTYATGVRAGGYNLRSTDPFVPPGPFDEEKSANIEVGLKSDWYDNRIRTNVAVFQNRIKDLQREVNVPSQAGLTQTIVNSADATISGIELEFQALLSDQLLLSASAGTLIGNYTSVREDLNRDGVIDQADEDLKIPRLAPWSMSLGLVYETAVGSLGTLRGSLNYSYRDASYYTDSNVGRINDANMVDASLALVTLEDRLRFSLYGKNLQNEPVNGGDTVLPFGPGQTFSPLNEGRTLGFEVMYDF